MPALGATSQKCSRIEYDLNSDDNCSANLETAKLQELLSALTHELQAMKTRLGPLSADMPSSQWLHDRRSGVPQAGCRICQHESSPQRAPLEGDNFERWSTFSDTNPLEGSQITWYSLAHNLYCLLVEQSHSITSEHNSPSWIRRDTEHDNHLLSVVHIYITAASRSSTWAGDLQVDEWT